MITRRFLLGALMTASFAPLHAQVQDCPADFASVPLYPKASLCQIFSELSPAAMSYHAKDIPVVVRDYYLQQFQGASFQTQKKRYVIQIDNGGRIIVSADGKGSQVDILYPQQQTGI